MLTSLRLFFAISAQLGQMIRQMVVDTAFLHAEIQEEIYINHRRALHYLKVRTASD